MTKYIEKFWRNATAADVVRAMAGETVVARFRDADFENWLYGKLRGVKALSNGKWLWLTNEEHWYCCQVYAPHQWWLDKPDPGEDYRLLEKFPDEPVRGGDFKKNTSGRWIELANGCNPAQAEGIWYRRRIESPQPEPKHYVLRVGDTCDAPSGRWITITDHGVEVT